MRIPQPGDTALVIYPPANISAEIDRWRRVYDPNHKIIPPHITLAFPFMPRNLWPENLPKIVDCWKPFNRFGVTLAELKSFAGEESILWLKPQDDGSLMRIRSAFEKCFPDYFVASEFAFVPHLTIGFFNSEEALLQAQKLIAQQLRALSFMVDEVLYVTFEKEDAWCIWDKISFGS